MTGPSGDWHSGRRRHVRVCREDDWGQFPAAPSWQVVPILGEGLTLKARAEHFRPDTLYGGWRRSATLVRVRRVEGRLVTRLLPGTAATLLQMGLDRQNAQPYSYCTDIFTPPDPRRCLGVMADRMTLTAGPAGGALVSVDLRGATEQANAPLTENDFDYTGLGLVPFRLDEATVKVDGVAVTDAEAFTLTVRNHLAEGPSIGGAVGYLKAGHRTVDLELRKLDDDGGLNAAIRSGATLSWQAVLAHPAGHTLTIDLPVLHPARHPEPAAPDRVARGTLHAAAGTDGQGDDVTYTLDLIP